MTYISMIMSMGAFRPLYFECTDRGMSWNSNKMFVHMHMQMIYYTYLINIHNLYNYTVCMWLYLYDQVLCAPVFSRLRNQYMHLGFSLLNLFTHRWVSACCNLIFSTKEIYILTLKRYIYIYNVSSFFKEIDSFIYWMNCRWQDTVIIQTAKIPIKEVIN